MRRQLYHVTVTLPALNPALVPARRERRTYTPRGGRQLARRLAWLGKHYPGLPISVTKAKPGDRSPVCP
jgi:hypothetical protein